MQCVIYVYMNDYKCDFQPLDGSVAFQAWFRLRNLHYMKFIFLETCTSLNMVCIIETLSVNTAVITYRCYITQGYIYCHMFLIVCIDWLKVEQIAWGFWRYEGDRTHLDFTDQVIAVKDTNTCWNTININDQEGIRHVIYIFSILSCFDEKF